MKKISHRLTFIYGKVLPVIFLLAGLAIAITFFFTDLKLKALLPLSLAIIMLTLGWVIYYRKLEVVYIDGKNLVIRDRRISFFDVISIHKNPLTPYYKVRYYENSKINSFKFLSKSSLYVTPSEIKEIQKLIKDRK